MEEYKAYLVYTWLLLPNAETPEERLNLHRAVLAKARHNLDAISNLDQVPTDAYDTVDPVGEDDKELLADFKKRISEHLDIVEGALLDDRGFAGQIGYGNVWFLFAADVLWGDESSLPNTSMQDAITNITYAGIWPDPQEFRKHFAVVRWTTADVTEHSGNKMSKEEARQWLIDNERVIQDLLVERGNQAIEELLAG
jgi:hypothetical protein